MTKAFHAPDRFRAILGRAHESGLLEPVSRTLTRWSWNVAGNCLKPVYREVYSASPVGQRDRLSALVQDEHKARTHGRSIEVWARCRKCDPCLRTRGYQWYLRAKQEVSEAVRTWFATLTVAPVAQQTAMNRARLRLASNGEDFDALPSEERFRLHCRELAPDITRFIKRVRKESGAAIRVLLVTERHKSGLPHFHALIHETSPCKPVRHAVLVKQWVLGFSKFNLVEPNTPAARYVTKYLSKELGARVRASKFYGISSEMRIALQAKAELRKSNSCREYERGTGASPTPHECPPPAAYARPMNGDCTNVGLSGGIPSRSETVFAGGVTAREPRLSNGSIVTARTCELEPAIRKAIAATNDEAYLGVRKKGFLKESITERRRTARADKAWSESHHSHHTGWRGLGDI